MTARHKLFDQLTEADVSDDEIEELYHDLQFVFENPFDALIEEAVHRRGAVYVEQNQPFMH